MEITLEQVEKLRARAELSYEEARALLERCGGSVLDALIELERQGRADAPENGGTWQSGQTPPPDRERLPVKVVTVTGSGWENFWKDFKCLLGQAWEILKHLPDYRLAIKKNGRTAAALPLWAALALLLVVFRITAPLAVLGLILGYRYRVEKEK